jgi:aryl-alcohol dehydrogenase-like predicted oxidoreductase
MNYVKLGNTGLQVSRFCLGCMSYGKSESDSVARHAQLGLDFE